MSTNRSLSAGETELAGVPAIAIAAAAREAFVMIDEAQRIVAVNPAAERMFRVRHRELHGQPLEVLLPPRARATHARHVRAFAESGVIERPMREREHVAGMRADGEVFPAEAHISRVDVMIDERPRTFFIALLRDLTHEQSLQDQVEMLLRRVRSLLEAAPVAMWMAEGKYISLANQAAETLFGVPRGGLEGRAVLSLLTPESRERAQAQIERVLAGGPAPAPLTVGLACSDDSAREVELATAVLPDHGHMLVQIVLGDVTERQRSARQEQRLRDELRRLSASVVEAREEERRHIARELHDELGQRLSAIKIELLGRRAESTSRVEADRIAGMAGMIDDTVAALRRIAADLRPLMLDDLGLNAAVEALARDAGRRMDLAVKVRLDETDPPVDDKSSIALYRMVQEALTNVGRHAKATEVKIALHLEDDAIVLTVRDNGVGFPSRSNQHEGRYGLLGMRERAYMLGGQFAIDNPPGGGGRITVRLPVPGRGRHPADPAGSAGPLP